MYKSYKTELNPTDWQKNILENYFKVCVEAYNRYIIFNIVRIEENRKIVPPKDYLRMIKDRKISGNGSEFFVKPYYERAVLYTLGYAEKSLRLFQSNKTKKPNLKKQGTKNISIHFTANSNANNRIECERHRINIPFIGWIRIKEKGYIPYDFDNQQIISGWIKKAAGRYYVSALVRESDAGAHIKNAGSIFSEGIGIDLNVNNFACLSDGTIFENVNKGKHIRHLKAELKRETRRLSRMKNANCVECNKEEIAISKMGAGSNYGKQLHKVDTIYQRINSIQRDYVRKCVKAIVDKNPRFIAMEDLCVTEMTSDPRFARYISEELFYEFKIELYKKCRERGIEFRVINKWIPTSKMCHACGFVKKQLTPGERDYICPSCGVIINRDYNASLNIRDATNYVIWEQ